MLTTPRLELQQAKAADAAALASYYVVNWEHLQPWEPQRHRDPRNVDYWHGQLPGQEAEQARGASLMLLMRRRGQDELTGTIRFSQIFRGGFQACYLGFGLAQSAVGQGLMQEALTTAIAHMFEDRHLHRIMANYLPRNERSGRLLQRLGFVIEGTARDYLQINGRWEDHILTAKTNTSLPPSIA
jgi:ribosomal-protein-alanine N-acetyltransferase